METREKVYPVRKRANRYHRWLFNKNKGEWQRKLIESADFGGRGHEIVREALACRACAAESEPSACAVRPC